MKPNKSKQLRALRALELAALGRCWRSYVSQAMAKSLIFIGSSIILYTIFAIITGMPEITDYMPIEWFIGKPEGIKYYRIVESDIPSHLWFYTILVGFFIAGLGLLLLSFKKAAPVVSK